MMGIHKHYMFFKWSNRHNILYDVKSSRDVVDITINECFWAKLVVINSYTWEATESQEMAYFEQDLATWS